MSELVIRDYQPGDEQGILPLFETVFGQSLSLAQWDWKYRRGGAAPVLARIALDSDGRILAHVGAVELAGWLDRRPLPMLQICDIMVHPEARGHLGQRNLYTRLVGSFFEDLGRRYPGAFCYGFPGGRPFKLGQYAGLYDQVELAREISWPLEGAPGPVWRTREIAWSDPEPERAWVQARASLGLGLVRDRAYYQWRYATNPYRDYQLLQFRHWFRSQGHAVIRTAGEELWIMELQLAPGQDPAPALRGLADQARHRGLKHLRYWLPGRMAPPPLAQVRTTELVTTNVVRGFQHPTPWVRERMFYSLGDVDMF